MASFRQALSGNQKRRSKLQQQDPILKPVSPPHSKKKSKISGQPHKINRGDR
jgi:hypothetical protein